MSTATPDAATAAATPPKTAFVHEHTRSHPVKFKTGKWFEETYSDALREIGVTITRTTPSGDPEGPKTKRSYITLSETRSGEVIARGLTGAQACDWVDGYTTGVQRVPVWSMEPPAAVEGSTQEALERLEAAITRLEAVPQSLAQALSRLQTPAPDEQRVDIFLTPLGNTQILVSRHEFEGSTRLTILERVFGDLYSDLPEQGFAVLDRSQVQFSAGGDA